MRSSQEGQGRKSLRRSPDFEAGAGKRESDGAGAGGAMPAGRPGLSNSSMDNLIGTVIVGCGSDGGVAGGKGGGAGKVAFGDQVGGAGEASSLGPGDRPGHWSLEPGGGG